MTVAQDAPSLRRAMLKVAGRQESLERAGAAAVPTTQRTPATRRNSNRPDPRDTLALVEGAGAAFETLQLQLLTVLQNARTSLRDAESEKEKLRETIVALSREKDDWSQRARMAEATLGQAGQVLQTQQTVLEEALLREREAVQRAYVLELRLRQPGTAGRPG